MSKAHLARGIIWRVAVWGLAGGALLGAICGPISLALFTALDVIGIGPDAPHRTQGIIQALPTWLPLGVLFGAIEGAMIGFLLGLIDGCVLGIITILVPGSRTSAPGSRQTQGAVSAIISGLGAFLLLMWYGPPIPSYGGNTRLNWFMEGVSVAWLTWVVLPTVIAAGYGWWVGNRVASRVDHGSAFAVRHS